jgi:DNA (cytosine-5)-methyltransferase 1
VAFKPGQSEAAGGTFVTEEFAPTLQSQNNGSTAVPAVAHAMAVRRQGVGVVAFSHSAGANAHGIAYVEEGTPPIRGGGAGNSMPAVAQAMAVRRLTPRECERLQGFPDDYTLVEYRKKPAADGPRYRALGNSMAVPVMRWIGERIAMVEGMQ